MYKTINTGLFIGILMSISLSVWSDENKNVTVISGTSTADGKSTVHKEILEECLVSLPSVGSLQAQVVSSSDFLKGINGDLNKNDFTTTYTASIVINYMLYQKELIIITTNSIQGKEPVTKIVEKRMKKQVRFDSNPSQGDIYAGKSKRKHYFSTAEGATKDVKQRASVWLNQQSAIICTQNK